MGQYVPNASLKKKKTNCLKTVDEAEYSHIRLQIFFKDIRDKQSQCVKNFLKCFASSEE